jgi:hypothetical protein
VPIFMDAGCKKGYKIRSFSDDYRLKFFVSELANNSST